MKELSKTSNVKERIIILFMYITLYLFYFNIQFNDFSTALLYDGKYFDVLQVYWNTWHFSFQLKHFSNPFVANHQLFPQTINLWMHAYTPILGLINLIINNPTLSINIGLFSVFILGSIFAYRLTSIFIRNKIYRFLASTFYMFNLYTINKMGVHYNLLLICITPLLIYTILKAIDINEQKININKKYAYQSILLIFINFLFDYYALFYAISFVILYVFYFKYFRCWLVKFNWKKSIVLVVFFILMHILIRILRLSGVSEKGALWSAADIRSYFLSSTSYYPDWLQLNTGLLSEHSLFIGYTMLFAFCFFIFMKNRDQNTRFLFFTIIVYVMVTSPIVRVNNSDLFFFPTGIIHFVPFVNNIRNPSRFLEMIFLLMPIFIFRKIELIKPRINYTWIIIIFLLSSYEQKLYAKSYLKTKKYDTNNRLKYSSSYTLKEKLPAGSGILYIPFGIKDGFEKWGVFDEEIYLEQSIHELKLSSAYYSRINEKIWDTYQSDVFYTSLILAQKDSLVKNPTEEQVKQFISNNKIAAIYIKEEFLIGKANLQLFLESIFPRDEFIWEEFNDRVLIILK